VLGAFCLLFGLTAQAQEGLQYEERIYDFGCVGLDFQVFHDYKLINYGTDTVKVDSVKVTCDCSSIQFLDSIVYPDDTVDFRLSFKTTNYYGPISRSALIYSDDKSNPEMKVYYVSTVGQWMHQVKPDPISLFFIPRHRPKKISISNRILDFIEVEAIQLLDDVIDVKTLKRKAKKGEKVELEVTPRADLNIGNYLTNFRITFKLPEGLDPLLMTIPVKIAKY
jgi:hypothetical protein